MSTIRNDPPWGRHAPSGLTARLICLSRAMPTNRLGRVLAGMFRKLVVARHKEPLDLTFFDLPVRFHVDDNLTEKRVAFMPQFFDPEERAALAKIVHPDFAFIDIGANAGFYALYVAALGGAKTTVIAVEPQPEMARRLCFNCAASGQTQIIHENVALAAGEGEAVLNIVYENRGASGFAPRGQKTGDESITVRTMALLALMDKHDISRPDAIKIDIEGAEDQVLPGFFEACPPERLPKMLIIERNDQWQVDCIALAKAAGYRETDPGRKNVILERFS